MSPRSRLTRRELLQSSAVIGGAALLSACAPQAGPAPAATATGGTSAAPQIKRGGTLVVALESDPVALGLMGQLAVWVTLPPTGRLTVSLMLPEPAAVQVPPPAPTHVQLQVSDAGNVSATVAAVTGSLPAFDAVIV